MATKPRRKKSDKIGDAVGLAGFFRINITDPDGTIRGDSGWKKNYITNHGLEYYIVGNIFRLANSYSLGSMGLASSSHIQSDNYSVSSFAHSFGTWKTVSTLTSSRSVSSGTYTMRCTAEWTSNILPNSSTIAAAALAQASNSAIMCQASFASSTVSSNQAVQVTYDIYLTA